MKIGQVILFCCCLLLDVDAVLPQNIDECEQGSDDCDGDATCNDTIGSYICTCNVGYIGEGREGTCIDIDECELGSDDCDVVATCNNTIGSYICTCNEGYTGEGREGTCIDIDECRIQTDDCEVDNSICINTVGSFDCVCDIGYTGDGRISCTVFRITEYVRNKTVTPEDSVSLTCSFFYEDANIDIKWAVDDSNDTLCGEGSCVITTTEASTTTSTLTIDGNSSLSIGTHDIKCTASVGNTMLTSSAVLTIQLAGLQLIVNHPDASNRSVVELTCSRITDSDSQVNSAQFERDNDLITSDNVTIIQINDSMISFSFTQDQEGWFRCITSDAVDISTAIGLAGGYFDT